MCHPNGAVFFFIFIYIFTTALHCFRSFSATMLKAVVTKIRGIWNSSLGVAKWFFRVLTRPYGADITGHMRPQYSDKSFKTELWILLWSPLQCLGIGTLSVTELMTCFMSAEKLQPKHHYQQHHPGKACPTVQFYTTLCLCVSGGGLYSLLYNLEQIGQRF